MVAGEFAGNSSTRVAEYDEVARPGCLVAVVLKAYAGRGASSRMMNAERGSVPL